MFYTAGGAALTLQLMRASRQLLVPLFGVAIGLDEAQIGLIYSLSAGIDMCLFYPVGWLVDRHGRKYSAVPSLTLFAIGLLLLPLVSGFGSLLAVACLLGLANGLGTGIVMIIGADLSRNSEDRSQFLGVWRLIGDVGMSGAPLLSAALVSVASLGAASIVAAGLGLVGAVVMLTLVPETLERAPPRPPELP
jgi:MFS family permease